MSEALPSPPASPARSTTPEQSDTIQAIDDLLERYLYLLDEHQRLHQELGNHLSAGFISLARANHSCPPGRRYGEDYYDDRMKAVKKVIARSLSSKLPDTKVLGKPPSSLAPSRFMIVQDKSSDDLKNTANDKNADQNEVESSATADQMKPTNKHPPNPIHWFGILVPPALRAAQNSFTSALDGPLPTLANVITEMHEVEQKISDLRKLVAIKS
ncbi:predicted protein [Uncinocarpus reesii 1704]|uniref:Vacuolar ATPase assembly protein VMA22 n=1 Tax=Uncinocarpus reesii (strain UAMH 1704) TaxID=336963 RepID=C4JE65_UNCRE|nr:uncharacterized protein UREG_00489 [Uncinocarpus reesii 1704]EEP75643.1 predicted protein [Uncinocarpus reesii 1704]